MAIPRLRKRNTSEEATPRFFDRHLAIFAFVVLAGIIAAYVPALQAGFIWDDDDHFTHNPYVTEPGGLVTIWTTTKAIYYPLTLTTWWVMRRLFDLNPFPYHLITVVLHAANAILFAGLLRRLAIPGAFLAGAIFAFHPMQVESVAWATELKNTQSGLFFLLAILAFLRADDALRAGSRWWPTWLLSMLMGVAAILSKPSTVPLPGVLLVLLIWLRGSWDWKLVARVAPLVVLALLSSLWTIYEQKHHSNAKGPEWDYGFVERLVIAGRAFWFYVGKFLWPEPLIFIYPRWEPATGPAVLHIGWVLAVAGPLALSVAALRGIVWARASLALWLLYGGLLFPVLGFFNIYFNRFSFVADHFAYLALMIPSIAAGLVVAKGIELLDPELRRVGWAIAFAIPVVLGAMSWRQTPIYKNEEVLWRDTLALNPNAWIGENNLGFELTQQGRFEESLAHFRRALELKPDYEEAHNNLGFALLELGRPAEAIAPLRRAVELRQPFANAMMNLANALAGTGELDEAASLYTSVVQLMPNDAAVHANHGSILAMKERFAEAREALRRAAQLDPSNAEVTQRLAFVESRLKP